MHRVKSSGKDRLRALTEIVLHLGQNIAGRAARSIKIITTFRVGRQKARQAERLKFCSHSSDMDGDAVCLRLKRDPPHIREQLALANAATGLLREAPKQPEFARMETKPPIIHSAIAVQQIQSYVTGFAESGYQSITIWEYIVSRIRIHRRSPLRIE